MHRGEILAYKSETGQHQVFYEDGEDEWVDLAAQKVKSWQAPARGLVTAPGLPEGQLTFSQRALQDSVVCVHLALNGDDCGQVLLQTAGRAPKDLLGCP